MFGLFTKNLDTMEKATKKRSLEELDNIHRLKKEEMGRLLGGNEKQVEKKRSFFDHLWGPSPCKGRLPQ